MGAIEGGYQALVDRLAERIRGMGGKIHLKAPIRHIPASATGRALGVVTEDGLREHDTVVTTQLRPNLQGMLAPELEAQLGADPLRYMGHRRLDAVGQQRDAEEGRGQDHTHGDERAGGILRLGSAERGHAVGDGLDPREGHGTGRERPHQGEHCDPGEAVRRCR